MAEVLKIKLVEPHQLSLFKQPLAQIEQALNEPNQPPIKLYYVHYIDYNKRLDEWVTIDRMKLDKIQAPVSSSSSSSAAAATSSSGLGNSAHSASQSHLCNISNSSNLKDLAASGLLKHDLSGDEHNHQTKKKKVSKQQTPSAVAAAAAAAAAAMHQGSLHGSVSVPVNLSASTSLKIASHSAQTETIAVQAPPTPLNDISDALPGYF